MYWPNTLSLVVVLKSRNPENRTLANSEDSDEMQHWGENLKAL